MRTLEIIQHSLNEHGQRTGFELPWALTAYVSQVVTDNLKNTELCPWGTFAEGYLRLYSSTSNREFKDFADKTLLFVSIMPEYGQRRGLDPDYYASLAISAYYTLGDLAGDPRYTQLGNWFYHLQQFLNTWLHQDQPFTVSVWR